MPRFPRRNRRCRKSFLTEIYDYPPHCADLMAFDGRGELAVRAARRSVCQSDLDSIDREIAELWSGVEQLQAHVVRNQDVGRPTAHLLDILDAARNELHARLRRRTEMFIALVMGDERTFEPTCSSPEKGAPEREFEHRWREGVGTRGADTASGR